MKKYVLSAVVTSLLVPWAYAMDGGAAPAVEVEVEVPAVETPAVEEVAVDVGEVAPVDVTTLEVSIETGTGLASVRESAHALANPAVIAASTTTEVYVDRFRFRSMPHYCVSSDQKVTVELSSLRAVTERRELTQ